MQQVLTVVVTPTNYDGNAMFLLYRLMQQFLTVVVTPTNSEGITMFLHIPRLYIVISTWPLSCGSAMGENFGTCLRF